MVSIGRVSPCSATVIDVTLFGTHGNQLRSRMSPRTFMPVSRVDAVMQGLTTPDIGW